MKVLSVHGCVLTNLETSFLKSRDSYPTEHYLHAASSSDMIYHILIFLDASPLTLFLGAPRAPREMVLFLESSFTWFTSYLVSDNDVTVRMTSNVARKLMIQGTEGHFHSQAQGAALDFPILKYHFWKSTSEVLTVVAQKVINMASSRVSTLCFFRDYLEARLNLIKKFKVSAYNKMLKYRHSCLI